jgi:hypothetical protein
MRSKTFGNNWPRPRKALAEANRDASEYWKNYLEKIVEELRASKERCFEKSMGCVKKIKASFANVGVYSNKDNFIRGDPEGVIDRDGNFTRGFGYPRISDPMDSGSGMKFNPRVSSIPDP